MTPRILFVASACWSVLLSGCAGGGGGGGSATPAAAVPSTTETVTNPPAEAPEAESFLAALLRQSFEDGAFQFPVYVQDRDDGEFGQRYGNTMSGGTYRMRYRTPVGESTLEASESNVGELSVEGPYEGREVHARRGPIAIAERQINWSGFGNITDETGGTTFRQPFYYGLLTKPAEVSLTGRAQYMGDTRGVYTDGSDSRALAGVITLVADFDANRISGRISSLTVKDGSGTPIGLPLVFTWDGTDTRLRSDRVGPNVVVGGITARDASTGITRPGSGDLVGRFFGPLMSDITGAWRWESTGGTQSIAAGYGTSYDNMLPRVAAQVPATLATAAPWDPDADGIALAYLVASTLPMLRTRTADGALIFSRESFDDYSVLNNKQDWFDPESIDTSDPDAIVARNDQGTLIEARAIDDPNGRLHHVRYGSLVSAWSPSGDAYAFGAHTPIGNLPTRGVVDYLGTTVGTLEDVNGVHLMTGSIRVVADFDRQFTQGGVTEVLVYRGESEPQALHRRFIQDTPFFGNASIGNHGGTVSFGAGPLGGRFFGLNGEEIGGTWTYDFGWGDTLVKLRGAFAGRIVTDDHPSGPLLSPTFISSAEVDFPLYGAVRRTTVTQKDDGTFIGFVDVTSGTSPQFLRPSGAGDTSLIDGGRNLVVPNVRALLFGGYEKQVVADGTQILLLGRATLTYSQLGYWAEDIGTASERYRVFHTGIPTAPTDMPRSGQADYVGGAMAIGVAIPQRGSNTSVVGVSGNLQMSVDFGTGALQGEIRGIGVFRDFTRDMDVSGGSVVDTVRLSGTIVGATFQGAATPYSVNTTIGTGEFSGRFYGPGAAEMGGKWAVRGPAETDFDLSGAFAGHRY